jgi:hypothetical protein
VRYECQVKSGPGAGGHQPGARPTATKGGTVDEATHSGRNLAAKSGTHSETWAGGRGAPVASFVPWQEGRGHGYTSRGAARALLRSGLAVGMEITIFDPELDSTREIAEAFTAAVVEAFSGVSA